MSIRTRLVVVSLLVALPVASVLVAYVSSARSQERYRGLASWVEGQLDDGAFQRRCVEEGYVATPPTYVRVTPDAGQQPPRAVTLGQLVSAPGSPGYRFFAFDESLERPYPAAILLPGVVYGALASSSTWRSLHLGLTRSRTRMIALPGGIWHLRVTGLGGNCSLVAASAYLPGLPRRDATDLAALVAAVLVAALFSGESVVRRVRRLTSAVRESAESGYEVPVRMTGRDEIAALARTFNDAGEGIGRQLQEVARREGTLREFVANVGHDLATPMSVLQGHLSALERQPDLPGSARESVSSAISETAALGAILHNLEATARLETPGWIVDLSPTDLVALVERTVARYQPLARAARVNLNVAVPDAPLTWNTDSTLFEQALGNLVDNAIRYNRPGGHVGVVLDRAERGFMLTVDDDGPGVSDAELARLGERYFRTDEARSRRLDGQGIGLAIVRSIAERLGLALEFRRPAGHGLLAELRGSGSDPGLTLV